MKAKSSPPAYPRAKRDALFGEGGPDSYRSRRKPASPTACPDCNAVFQGSRWQWTPAPTGSLRDRYPAGQRIRDDFPAGYASRSKANSWSSIAPGTLTSILTW